MNRFIRVFAAVVIVGACSKKNETPAAPEAAPEAAKEEKPAAVPEKTTPAPTAKAPEAKTPAKTGEAAAPADAKAKAIHVRDVGFQTPESVLFDPEMDLYLVSNINGSPLAVDGNGFISRVGPNGKVIELKWIDGAAAKITLNAPKGMALVQRTLYVSDLDHVRMFDCESSNAVGNFRIPNATFLNDIAPGKDGSVYVSDSGFKAGKDGFAPSGTDAVYKISKSGKISTVAKGAVLGHPNGLLLDGDVLWVVTFGTGELYSLARGKRAEVFKPGKGKLDGLVKADDGEYLFSSWEGQLIYKGPAVGPYEVVVKGVKAPADIGYDFIRKRVLIPLFMDNAVVIHPL
jgi:hypothetical protein